MKLNARHVICSRQDDGKHYSVFEVFHSKSGGRRDDHKSVGYLAVPWKDLQTFAHDYEIEFAKNHGPHYQLTPLSSELSTQFYKNPLLELNLPDSPVS